MMRIYTIGSCLLLLAGQVNAQKGVNSLYSAFGTGDLEEKDYSRNFGVGSAGIARSSASFLNELNPASYGRLPMETFFFEASVAAKSITYTGNNITQPAGDIGFKRFALGFKPHKKWGLSIGLTPYSRVDYKLLNTTSIEGTGTGLQNAIEGYGSINRLYFSNALQLTKHFSLGVSTAMLFGPLNITDSLGNDEIHTELNSFNKSFEVTTGLQYHGKIAGWDVGAGLTYRLRSTLKTEQDFSIRDADNNILYQGNTSTSDFTLPVQWGAGITVSNGSITWLADYRRQQWAGVNPNKGEYKYVNAQRFAGGLEYSFYKYYFNSRSESLSVQAGFNYSTGYITVKGEQIRDIGFSAGASMPSKTGHLRYYLGLEGGQRGSAVKGLIQENYLNIVLHLSLRDNWFFKRKEL